MAGALITTGTNQVEAYRSQLEGHTVLLFDGVCSLCNHTVQFLLARDGHSHLRFVPQESALGQQLLALFAPAKNLEGIVVIDNALTGREIVSSRSDAFSRALQHLSAPWRIVGRLIHFVPRPLREFGYGLVARYRYRIFGRYENCPLPSPEQRSRILGVNS